MTITRAERGLIVENLSVGYEVRGRVLPVVENLDFEVASGEAYGVVGESGCGKTSVALAILNSLPANGKVLNGAVKLQGDDILSLHGRALRRWWAEDAGIVYQEAATSLNPLLTIGKQVVECIQATGVETQAKERARELLARVALSSSDSFLRRYPHELSGGQQQRILVAMAIANQPRLLMLDEPTTGLDATVEAEILDLFTELRRDFDGVVVFISHDLGLVSRVCERVGVLYGGRLVEQGATETVLSEPRHPYTAGLLSCVPRLNANKVTRQLAPIPGSLPALGAPPPGCRFAPRCELARPRCSESEPELFGVSKDHVSRCFYLDEVPYVEHSTETRTLELEEQNSKGPLLEIQELTKRYGSVRACEDVSLTIGRGEILGLVGESGSGKTTLGRCIVGLTKPDAGDIILDGSSCAPTVDDRDAPLKRRLQMVFQSPQSTLNPSHTVGRVLQRAIKKLGGEVSVEQLAESVQLDKRYLKVKAAELSGGLKQRVAIARALAGQPSLVVCDEPVSALDVSVQAAILELLADLQAREKVSLLFISHDLGVVRYLADRIAVMYLGQIVENGPSEEVFTPPHHPYTEALLSAAPLLDKPQSEQVQLRGGPPSSASVPQACRFHTRCPYMIPGTCDVITPPWRELDNGHYSRCHLSAEELSERQGSGLNEFQQNTGDE